VGARCWKDRFMNFGTEFKSENFGRGRGGLEGKELRVGRRKKVQ